MRSASGGPRVLLRRLRETMAEKVSAQERLDKIVVLIAANMVAEVCSTYVLRVDNTLELYATEGLNRDAVHRTVLSAHEGLVGLVASEATPLNLSDAQSHPAFSYRPETGEEIYHSFLGVPISTACWSAATSAKAASTATCWKPIGCLPTTRAGRTSCMRRSAPASPRKPPLNACSPTPARACCARPIPICATGCMTWKIS